MTLSGFFLLCLIAGLLYAVISLILSGGPGASPADVDTDSGGIDTGDISGEITFSPVSPTVIATFITAFGAGGIVSTEGLKWGALPAVAVACGSGFLIAGMVYVVLNAVYKRTQGSSEPHTEDLIGATAEVITPISPDSSGEIAYVIRGARFTTMARSVDKQQIGKDTLVEIVRVVGSTAYVKPWSGEAGDTSNEEG